MTAASASLSYQRGQADRYLVGTGGGSVTHQQIAVGQDFYRLLRGEASLEAATGMGQRSGLTIGGGASYEPTYLFARSTRWSATKASRTRSRTPCRRPPIQPRR